MKKKIAMVLLVTVMATSVFAGCGNSVEGNGKVQAAMADAGNSQEDSEGKAEGTDAGESTPEATAEPTAQPTPKATAEPTAEPTEEPTTGSSQGTAANDSAGVNNTSATNQPANQSTSNQSTQQSGSTGTAASASDSVANNQDNQSTTTDVQTSNYLSQSFINYLNQQRSAAGLPEITWNSGLELLALTRAKEISENFNHPTVMEASEIILATDSSDPASWYNSWHDSEGHRLVLEDKWMTDGACAVYQVGNYYYVIFACNVNYGQEYVQEQFDQGNMQEYTWTASDGTEVTGYHSEGSYTINPDSEEDLQAAEERAEEAGEEWVDPTTFDWGSGQ